MSTRAMYTFTDRRTSHNVYKHYDGYPEGGLGHIKRSLEYAWESPRFEAAEFAAAFITANKGGDGDVYLMKDGAWKEVAPLDLEYRYEITSVDGLVHVAIFDIHCKYPSNEWEEKPMFSGDLDAAQKWLETRSTEDEEATTA